MKEREQQIDRMATELFDILNPDHLRETRVGKAECIKLVERCLGYVEDKYGEKMR